MQSIQQNQIDLRRLFQILLRKKWLILICIVGALLPIIYYNKVALPVYEASTFIVCEEKKGAIPNLDIAQATLGNTFIMNLIQEVKSWSLANEVAIVLLDSALKNFPLPEPLPTDFNKEELFTSVIRNNISAIPVIKSDVIKINAQAQNAESACIIANTVAEILKKRNLNARLGEIHNVRETIEEQLKNFEKNVEKSAQALKDYKERNKVTYLDQESQEIFRRITEAEVEYNKVQTAHDAAQKRLKFIQDKLSQEREDLVAAITTTTSPWAQRLKESLIELEVQYTTLKVQDYDDNHPQMKKLKSQIDDTKKNLKEETLKIAMGENTIDPLSQIQQNLEEIATLEVEIHTFQAQEKALKKVLDSYNNSLTKVPEKELQLGRLLRDKAVGDNIYTMLLQKREESKITEAEKIGNIRIIDPARIPKTPIKPRKVLNLIIGLIVGFSFGIGLSFLIESFDKSIKTTEEVEEYINLPVFSTIPKIQSNSNNKLKYGKNNNIDREISAITSKLITGHDPKSPASEAFRTLRTNIQFAEFDSAVKTILLTSPTPCEGKSLITANLAITTAQMGLKTLLVDLDLRKPVQHSLFGKNLKPGIMDVVLFTTTQDNLNQVHELNEEQSFNNRLMKGFDSAINEIKHPVEVGYLHLLTCGTIPPNPSEILGSAAMQKFLDSVKKNYNIILLDTPPVLTVTDASILGRIVDGIILVIRAGRNSKQEILRAKDLLQRVKGNVIGCVLNEVDVVNSHYGYSYDKYYGSKK